MKNMKVLKCGGNMYVILVYDINLENKEGQRVLRNVFKTCKKYLVHIQNSVFEGEASESEFKIIYDGLMKIIDTEVDSVIIYKLRMADVMNREVLGIEKAPIDEIL